MKIITINNRAMRERRVQRLKMVSIAFVFGCLGGLVVVALDLFVWRA